MRASNLDILTPRLAWSKLSVYLISKLKSKLTRNHEYLFIIILILTSRSRLYNIILRIRLYFIIFFSYISYKLQPCNIRVFSLLKTVYREEVK